jgi:hypothetical protein
MLERLTDDERFLVVTLLMRDLVSIDNGDEAMQDARRELAGIIAKLSGPNKRVVIGPKGFTKAN